MTPQQAARGTVILAMYLEGQLNDQTLPTERMQIFKTKPFTEWPPDMQEALRPFGAEIIS